jgi:hypothetical protein
MTPVQRMKLSELELGVLEARNKLAAARVEYEMACDALAEGVDSKPPLISRHLLALELAVSQLVALECRHAVAVERLEVFQREVMS